MLTLGKDDSEFEILSCKIINEPLMLGNNGQIGEGTPALPAP